MFSWRNILTLFKFWGGDPKDYFVKIMRSILAIAYFSLVAGIILAGPTFNVNDGWQDQVGMFLLTAGYMTIIFGHALLGYAAYRKQPEFKSPDQPAKSMFKKIFMYMYLPAFILTGLLVGITLLLK